MTTVLSLFFGALFTTVALIQVWYWLVLHYGFRKAIVPQNAATSFPPLTVVVAARDEENNLLALRSCLSSQTYPDFEVVVADDGSTDSTPARLANWAAEDARVRIVSIDQPITPRKKNALTGAIALARSDRLVFTDADCQPGPKWLESLARASSFQSEHCVLVGYGPYRRHPGMLNRVVRFETLVTAFLTAASIGLGRPYMATGRNFSYSKRLFERAGGFEHSRKSLSGDDDLFVQHVHRHGMAEVVYVADPESFVPSEPPNTWSRWLRQKRRHTSAGRFYAPYAKLHLALFQGSGILCWLAPAVLGWPGVVLLGIRLTVQAVVLHGTATVFAERGLVPILPVLDLFYTVYNLVVAPTGLVRMPSKW